jgi:hypothetical protein
VEALEHKQLSVMYILKYDPTWLKSIKGSNFDSGSTDVREYQNLFSLVLLNCLTAFPA